MTAGTKEMKKYANLHGNSGVSEYSISKESIKIKFRNDHKIYIYSYSVTGRNHVQMLKSLAESGRGLATYIAKNKDVLKFTNES